MDSCQRCLTAAPFCWGKQACRSCLTSPRFDLPFDWKHFSTDSHAIVSFRPVCPDSCHNIHQKWRLQSSTKNTSTLQRFNNKQKNDRNSVCCEVCYLKPHQSKESSHVNSWRIFGNLRSAPLTRIHLQRCFGYFSNAVWEIQWNGKQKHLFGGISHHVNEGKKWLVTSLRSWRCAAPPPTDTFCATAPPKFLPDIEAIPFFCLRLAIVSLLGLVFPNPSWLIAGNLDRLCAG